MQIRNVRIILNVPSKRKVYTRDEMKPCDIRGMIVWSLLIMGLVGLIMAKSDRGSREEDAVRRGFCLEGL